MRSRGRSRREIAAALGISETLARALVHGTPRANEGAREAAVVLRRAGRSYSEITAEIGVARSTLSDWLRGVPAGDAEASPVDTGGAGRAAAVAARREEARRLREQGLSLSEIADRVGVSVKSVYYYTADLPLPPSAVPAGRAAADLHADLLAYWVREHARRAQLRAETECHYADGVQTLSREQLHLMAVTAYWCEGSKSKSYDLREQVTFINSDVGLIRLWLAYLDDIGFPRANRRFSLSIHETADLAAAEQSWAADIGVTVAEFRRATIKRHKPRTVRLNTGSEYRGCLIVRLTQCAELYRRIAGTWTGIMGVLPPPAPPSEEG